MSRKLFTAVGLMVMCGIALTEIPAEAIAWYGFSDLCLVGTWKGGKAGELEITMDNVTVSTRCENTQSDAQWCQPGEGSTGKTILNIPTFLADKETGTVSTGFVCISLNKFDHHPDYFFDEFGNPTTTNQHEHTCLPATNENLSEIPGTAHVTKIVNTWVLKDDRGRVIRRGSQTCLWNGVFLVDRDAGVCRPQHGGIEGEDPLDEVPDDPNGGGDYTCDSIESRK
jgi:hypothetical protein